MQLGGAGLEGLGASADKDTYLSRVQSLKEEIDSGLRSPGLVPDRPPAHDHA